MIKKTTKTRKRKMFVYACIVLITFQATLSLMQRMSYRFDENSDDNYCCVEMSRDCEILFEAIGIRTTVVSGVEYDYKDRINMTTIKSDGELIHFSIPREKAAHQWIILHIGPFSIPYESTWLLPMNPQWRGYKIMDESEGYCINGTVYKKEQNKIIK
jgi:hypothetical protein